MFDTLEACAAAWEQAGNHGDIQTRIARNARWIPYYAFLADGREEANAAIDPHAAAVADGLGSRGYLGAGSTVLEDYAVIAAQGGVAGHLRIGKGARIGAQSGVMRDVPAGEEHFGYPAQPVKEYMRQIVALKRLTKPRKSE